MTNESKSLNRKAQGEETRATLLKTGAKLFAQFGYHGVSMRTLAAEAEVNLATVGYHFGGKAGLYEAIIQSIIDVHEDIFPTADEMEKKMAAAAGDLSAQGEVVEWYISRVVHGVLGHEQHIWPVFIISRELVQPSDIFPKLNEEFFQPTVASVHAVVDNVLGDCDVEERNIVAHSIVGMITKFLEGYTFIIARMEWDSYDGHGVEKISSVLSKRIRGFLGLPMENK